MIAAVGRQHFKDALDMTMMQANRTSVNLRPGRPEDAEACGAICYEAFAEIAGRHNFPPDFPSVDIAINLMKMLLSHPRFFSVVAEDNSEVLGSNFLDERSPVAGLGPITVAAKAQNRRLGRLLMEAALNRAREKANPGVRLLQAAYHTRSLALYSTLGFEVREAIACMQGPAIGISLPDYRVRPAVESDLDACRRVCTFVHGHHRDGEVLDAIKLGTARVVEQNGRITGYATDLAFFAHAVGESNRDIMALIGSASSFVGPGILVPLRNTVLLQWCLGHNLKITQVMTLMSLGLYNEPAGAYLPSVLY